MVPNVVDRSSACPLSHWRVSLTQEWHVNIASFQWFRALISGGSIPPAPTMNCSCSMKSPAGDDLQGVQIFHRRSFAENKAAACACWLLRQRVNEMSHDCGSCRASCISRSPRYRRGLAPNRALSAIRFSSLEPARALSVRLDPGRESAVLEGRYVVLIPPFSAREPGQKPESPWPGSVLIIALQRRMTRFPLPFRPVLLDFAPSAGIGNILLLFQLVDIMPQFKTP